MFIAKISYSELFGKFIPNFSVFRTFLFLSFWTDSVRSVDDNKLIANKGRLNS